MHLPGRGRGQRSCTPLNGTPFCSAKIFSNRRRYLRHPSMISSITRCPPLALRELMESLTSTTMSPFLMTPTRSSLNRRIFTVRSSRGNFGLSLRQWSVVVKSNGELGRALGAFSNRRDCCNRWIGGCHAANQQSGSRKTFHDESLSRSSRGRVRRSAQGGCRVPAAYRSLDALRPARRLFSLGDDGRSQP